MSGRSGRSGRKPKPTDLHELHGTMNVTRHRVRKREPKAHGTLRVSPPWLTASQVAGWAYAVANAPAEVLAAIDQNVLAAFVVAEDRFRAACVAQADHETRCASLKTQRMRDGMLMRTKGGNLIQSPYLGIINRAAAAMVKYAAELGFTPASRPRLAVATGLPIEPGQGHPVSATPSAESLDTFLEKNPQNIH